MEVYVVIYNDRGLGPMVVGVFKDEAAANAFAKEHGRCWVQTSELHG